MKIAMSDIKLGLEIAMRPPRELPMGPIRSVTVFVSPKNPKTDRVRVSPRGKNSFIVTVGRPNFRERKFLALCKKAKTHPRKYWIQHRKPKSK